MRVVNLDAAHEQILGPTSVARKKILLHHLFLIA
jgi:hypothetical protein